MNLPFKIARRYLFAKKSTNAINIITGVAMFGIAVSTAALILVLSVFNGFEDLITSMYSAFNPDVRVAPVMGKTFEPDTTLLLRLRAVPGVKAVSEVLEEIAFFEYKNNQDFGKIKGVDDAYLAVSSLDSSIREGQFLLKDGDKQLAVLGLGMRNKLGVNIEDHFSLLSVYMPKRRKVSLFEPRFTKRLTYPVGTFITQQEFDAQYVITSLDFARDLMGYDEKASALELKLYPGFDNPATLQAIQEAVGDGFSVKNRYQQQEAFLKLMKMEKWLSFAIGGLMLLMISFNMVGALWMMVLEKQKDVAILKAMGTQDRSVRNIFLYQGVLISALGILLGFVFALLIYYLQKHLDLISMPGDFVVGAYPASLRAWDFLVVAITVGCIGLLASLPPAYRAQRIPAMIKEE